MPTNHALSNTAQTTTAAKPVRTIHEHTLMSAIECFDNAVDKNVAKFKEPFSAAVQRALTWGEGTLLKQIKDEAEAKAFAAFLARMSAENPKPVREERPKGPVLLTGDRAKARLEAAEKPFLLAEIFYRDARRWDPSEIQKIEDAISAVLGTAKRKEYVRKGVILTEETIAQAADEVKKFITWTKREAEAKRAEQDRKRGKGASAAPSTQSQKPQGNQRPKGNFSGGYRGQPSNFSNHQTLERKHDGPKITNKPSDLEKQAAELKEIIAGMERGLNAIPANADIEARVNARLAAIDAIKAKKKELADIRALIAIEHAERAEANKKARIASAAASSKASLTIPSVYKVKEKQAKPETQKGKKKR